MIDPFWKEVALAYHVVDGNHERTIKVERDGKSAAVGWNEEAGGVLIVVREADTKSHEPIPSV